MEAHLDLVDRRIRQYMGRQPGATILGLLPVEPADQESLFQAIRIRSSDRFHFFHLQRMYPAALSYTIALALSKGATEANLYSAMEKELGLEIPQNRRAEFSETFATGCKALGLIMPEADEETHSDRYLRPIIFQAGILHYWVDPLANSVTSYLERNPCPDLEDEQAVRRFARELGNKVPQAQARLRRTLHSIVGPLVCRAILQAFSSRDFDQLPAHLRESMKEARKQSGGESIRSPYLRLNADSGTTEVVLPRQSSKLADYNTCWVFGSTTYNALVERTLNVSDIPEQKCEFTLKGFRKRFTDQHFTVKLFPDAQDPFFVFRAIDGRRVPVGARPLVELPLGDYDFLLPTHLSSNEEETFLLRGAFKVARVEVFPGRSDLEILLESGKCVIRPRLAPDLLVQDSAGNKIHGADGSCIFYGESLEVHAYTPTSPDSESMLFKVESLGVTTQLPTSLTLAPEYRGAYAFFPLSPELVNPFLKNLPAGIHDIQITAEGKLKSFSRRFFYWKGFCEIDRKFGFVCSTPPRNFDSSTSVGLISEQRGVRIASDHVGPEVILGIRQPSRTFTIAKPGLWLKLSDLRQHESKYLGLGNAVEVTGHEQLTIQSGDSCAWKIYCGSTVLTEIKPGSPKATLSVAALLGQFGESMRLEAKSLLGHPVKLVSLAKANLARCLTVDSTSGSAKLVSSFRLGCSQLSQLRVSISDLADRNADARNFTLDATEGAYPLDQFATCAFKTEDTDWLVTIDFDLIKLPPSVYAIDFASRKTAEGEWQPMKVADKHGLSESRLIVANGPDEREGDSPWRRVLAQGFHYTTVDRHTPCPPLTIDQLKEALESLQSLLLFKYSSAAWFHAQWLGYVLKRVCKEAYSSLDDASLAVFAEEAVKGLTDKSEWQLSIHSTLIFGSNALLLAQKGQSFRNVGDGSSFVARSFRELGTIACLPKLSRYDFPNGRIDFAVFTHFENAAAVSSGRADEFQGFKVSEFFNRLAEDSEELDFRQSEIKVDTLLGAQHFLSGVRALNRRFRPLEEARNNNDTGTSLTRLSQEIQACSNRLGLVAPTVKDLVKYPNYVELSIPVRFAESVLVQNVSDLLLTIAGLGRLASCGILSRERFLERLRFLVTGTGDESGKYLGRRLSLFLSLAPELFAFYMLLWETALKPRTT